MTWTRRPLVRAAALAAAAYLVITRADERDTWFWTALALVALGVVGLLVQQRGSAGAVGPSADAASARQRLRDADEVDVRLGDLLHDPAVASAWASTPSPWEQVTGLDDPSGPLGPAPAAELAEHVWLLRDRLEWQIAVGEELEPYLDLDVPDTDDAVLRVLRAHPAVEHAWHEDREVYVVQPRHDLELERFARLAARALAEGQAEAVRRRG